MSLVNKRVLVLEDDVYKASHIKRALQYAGIRRIHHVMNQEEGFQFIYECEAEQDPVQLIVTDMHYPLENGSVADTEAGFKLLERMEREKRETPVVICSSRNIKEPKAFGTVWYSMLRDLDHDFYEVLKKLK